MILSSSKGAFRLSIWISRRRLHSSWRLTAVTSLGILTAVVLLSATALYSQLLAEAGVRFALFSGPAPSHHIQILSENRPLGPEDYARLRQLAESVIRQRLGSLAVDLHRYGRAQAGMQLTANPARKPPPIGSPSGRPLFMTGFEEHSRIIDGRWPNSPGTLSPEGAELEAVIGQGVARDMGYGVGSRVFITPFRSEPEERIVLNIVGIAEPVDPRDEFWFGFPSQFSPQTVGEILVIPFYVTEHDFLDVIGRRFPTAVADFGFNVFVDPSVITAGTVDSVQASLEGLETDLNKDYPRTFVFTRLELTLNEFERDLTLARVPVYVFVSLVVIVILYFLVLITGILGRTQNQELGLLRSRGASVLQVCGVLVLVEGVLALVWLAVGVPLAWLIVRFALLPTFGDPGGGPIEVAYSAAPYWIAAVGAAVSVVVLAVSAAGRARTGVADSLAIRSRPPEVSFFHRYYLDLLAVLLAGLVWWQFRERDGFLSRSLSDRGVDIDPILILGPALGLLTAALLLMRLFPWLVRVIVWLCMRAGPGWSSYGLARLARDPVLPSSLAIMLMLTAALGVFGATFQASLARSQSDQTKYRIGGEYVVSGPGVRGNLAGELSQVLGVTAATPVLRDSVSLIEGHAASSALLIAADPQALAQTAWYREDFSTSSLAELTALLQTIDPVKEPDRFGVPLPNGVERIGVWLDTSGLREHELQADINVWARLSDAEGRYRNVSLGGFGGPASAEASDWRLFEGDLPQRMIRSDAERVEGAELRLAGIFFTTSSFSRVTAGRIHLDDFTAYGNALPEEGVPVEEFEAAPNDEPVEPRWTPLSTESNVPDRLEISASAARSGASGMTFSWEAPFGGEQRGIHIPPVSLPLPAIGGNGLNAGQALRIKHGQASVPVQIVGTTDLFPTVTDFQRPFLLLDIDTYLTYLKFLPPSGLDNSPQEIWLSLDDSQGGDANPAMSLSKGIASELPALTLLRDRDHAAEVASRNPLAGGGWNGLTALSMGCIALAVVTAMLFHAAASVRAARVDTAVARALGLSTSQLYMVQAAENWLMGGAALAAGAAIGYWPGRELVRMLDLSPGNASGIPPMIPDVHALILAAVLAGLTATVMASAILGAALASRIGIANALREGA